ncbi:MAG: hypothetical protein K2X29_04320, partial [Candidatus Obscuribacterales bacterium]|nr:hypothetical protein [Candidatus Obscuribacterales bacterium]
QVAGAALYDGMKETRAGETNLGNMAGGAASFTFYEVGNAIINKKFHMAGSLSLVGKTTAELNKAAWRIVPGVLGSATQIAASRTVSGDRSEVDFNSTVESLVTGGAMNVVLPWVQHGIGKGIDVASIAAKKSIPFQRYNTDVESEIVKELRDRNPEARVKIEDGKLETVGQISLVRLAKKSSEAEQGHELWHIDAKKNLDRAEDMQKIVNDLRTKQVDKAKEKYFELRNREEVWAQKIEDAIVRGDSNFKVQDVAWRHIDASELRWQRIASDKRYQNQFEHDFEKLKESRGRSVNETDYISNKMAALIDSGDIVGTIRHLYPKMEPNKALMLNDAVEAWSRQHPDISPVNAFIGFKLSAFDKALSAIKFNETGIHRTLKEEIVTGLYEFEPGSNLHKLNEKLSRSYELSDDVQLLIEEFVQKRNVDHKNENFVVPEGMKKNLSELGFDPDLPSHVLRDYEIDCSDLGQDLYSRLNKPTVMEIETALGETDLKTLLESSNVFSEGVGDIARKSLPLPSLLQLTKTFGNKVDVWIDKQRLLNRALYDFTHWLPDLPPSQSSGLGDFLIKNHRQATPALAFIANRWGKLSEVQKVQDFKELAKSIAKSDYPAAKVPQLLDLAVMAGVHPDAYLRLESRFLASLAVPSPFPLNKQWTKDGLRGYFLPRSDVRGLFLGQLTDCCQHAEGVGRDCAWYGQGSPNSGFFIVEDINTKQIVAQSWAWKSEDGGLCFDNIEGTNRCKHSDGNLVQDIYEIAAKELTEQFKVVTVGTQSSDVDVSRWTEAGEMTLKLPSDYIGRSDARKQMVLAEQAMDKTNNAVSNR